MGTSDFAVKDAGQPNIVLPYRLTLQLAAAHGCAVKERYGTVLVYLRRGSILAESQHPAHKKQ